MTWVDQQVNKERVIAVIVALVAISAFVWWLWPSQAQAGDRFAFAGKGICIGGEEGPKYQCTPYYKPDRCNPAIGNWVNASDITCPPDAWNDTKDRVVGGKRHRCQEEKS